jgi:hypothetical protein
MTKASSDSSPTSASSSENDGNLLTLDMTQRTESTFSPTEKALPQKADEILNTSKSNNTFTETESSSPKQDQETEKCRRLVRRTHSSMSADSKPDPPSRILERVITDDEKLPRGNDVLARKHRYSDSMHISQLDELQSQEYFINVPSSSEKLDTTKEDEEMTEDFNDDSQQPFSVLLEAVQQVRNAKENDDEQDDDDYEEYDDDQDLNDNANHRHPDDVSSIRSVTASAADSSPPGKRMNDDYLNIRPRSPPSYHSYDVSNGYENGTASNVFRRTSSNGNNLTFPGPDSDVALLPRVDEHDMFQPHPLLRPSQQMNSSMEYTPSKSGSHNSHNYSSKVAEHRDSMPPPPPPSNGRRKIRLRLQEEIPQPALPLTSSSRRGASILGHLRRRSNRIMFGSSDQDDNAAVNLSHHDEPNSHQYSEPHVKTISRGIVTVSWFEGTWSLELQEHVRKTVLRKLGLDRNADLVDYRLFDESVNPPEGT